jgi:sugar lactone lactonase YvrE
METLTPTTFLSGLKFPECPRWHDGRLWFSDMRAGRVMVVDQAGRAESIVEVRGDPGGLGFRPDGSLIVVSMRERRLLILVTPDGEVRPVAAATAQGWIETVRADVAGAGREPGHLALISG